MDLLPLTAELFPAWDAFVARHPQSTIYHTSAWLRLLREVFGYASRSLVAMDKGEIVAGVPLFGLRGFMGKRLVSSPFRDRGGLLGNPEVDLAPLLEQAVGQTLAGRCQYLLLKQSQPLDPVLTARWGLQESRHWLTTLVDLSAGSEAVWRKLKNNAVGPVKQAQKLGVRVYAGERQEDMATFYQIFLENRRHLGIPCFPPRFFQEIWEKLCQKGQGQLFIAEKAGQPLAGLILLLHKGTAIDGYAASRPSSRELRPNDLLVWRAIQWAAREGCQVFDFGADSPRQPSLLAFKKKWRGVQQPMYHYYFYRDKNKIKVMDSSDEKYEVIRTIIRLLPFPLYRLLSQAVVADLG